MFWYKPTIFFITVLVTVSVSAQPGPDTLWTRYYSAGRYEFAASLDTTFDGGYIMSGSFGEDPNVDSRAFFRKIDSFGNEEWTRILQTLHTNWSAPDIIQASDSSFVAIGNKYDWSGLYYPFIIKYSPEGDSLWCAMSEYELRTYTSCVLESDDGGYYMAGKQRDSVDYITEHARIAKYSRDGELQWIKLYAFRSMYLMGVMDIEGTADGGFILACQAVRFPQTEPYVIYLICAAANGDTVWTRVFAHPNSDSYVGDICRTPDNRFILSCSISAEGYYSWVVCINSLGDTLWTRDYYHYAEDASLAGETITSLRDNGFLYCGTIWNIFTGYRAFAMRLDPQGDVVWITQYGFNTQIFTTKGVKELRNGGYTILYALAGLNQLGNPSGLARLAPELAADPTNFPLLPQNIELTCYPNPFNSNTTINYMLPCHGRIKLLLFNVLGEKVTTLVDDVLDAGIHSHTLNAGNMGSGVYFCRMEAGTFARTQKIVLMK